jgi:hypothetical protein
MRRLMPAAIDRSAKPCDVVGHCLDLGIGQSRSDGRHLSTVLALAAAVNLVP